MSTKTKIARESMTEGTTIARAFGVADKAGREFGAKVNTFTVEMVPQDDPTLKNWGYDLPVGTAYGYTPQATRAGKSYGPIQHYKLFASAAERDAAVEKYFASAAKRAAKNKKATPVGTTAPAPAAPVVEEIEIMRDEAGAGRYVSLVQDGRRFYVRVYEGGELKRQESVHCANHANKRAARKYADKLFVELFRELLASHKAPAAPEAEQSAPAAEAPAAKPFAEYRIEYVHPDKWTVARFVLDGGFYQYIRVDGADVYATKAEAQSLVDRMNAIHAERVAEVMAKPARPRFNSAAHEKIYDACIAQADDVTSEFYVDGRPRTGSGYRAHFWAGAGKAAKVSKPDRSSMNYAAYVAGVNWAKANPVVVASLDNARQVGVEDTPAAEAPAADAGGWSVTVVGRDNVGKYGYTVSDWGIKARGSMPGELVAIVPNGVSDLEPAKPGSLETARLISAAPELLAAVVDLLNWAESVEGQSVSRGITSGGLFDLARAAIAKARGRTRLKLDGGPIGHAEQEAFAKGKCDD